MCSISVSRKISKIDPLFMQDNRSSKELRFFLRHRLDDDFEPARQKSIVVLMSSQ